MNVSLTSLVAKSRSGLWRHSAPLTWHCIRCPVFRNSCFKPCSFSRRSQNSSQGWARRRFSNKQCQSHRQRWQLTVEIGRFRFLEKTRLNFSVRVAYDYGVVEHFIWRVSITRMFWKTLCCAKTALFTEHLLTKAGICHDNNTEFGPTSILPL